MVTVLSGPAVEEWRSGGGRFIVSVVLEVGQSSAHVVHGVSCFYSNLQEVFSAIPFQ